MGYLKQQMIEDEWKESMYKPIARYLGIDEFDLEHLEFSIDEDRSNDGLVYSYIIEFTEESAAELSDSLDLEDGVRFRIHPSELHLYNDDEYYYNEDQYESIIRDKNSIEKLTNEISDLNQLLNVEIGNTSLNTILSRQIYIGLIGTMETYLSETFIKNVIENDELLRNYVESYPGFKKRKFELREIFQTRENLVEIAKSEMLDTIYHNLSNIRNMYKSTFKIEFPSIGELSKAVLKRHDLVHRNGKTKEGDNLEIDKEELLALINEITNFANEIELKISK